MRAASTVFYYGLLVAFAQALRAPAPGASVRLGAPAVGCGAIDQPVDG